MLTADRILAIPNSQPERLFPIGDFSEIKAHYLKLLKDWHPDHCKHPLATEVTTHIAELRSTAEKKLLSGLWEREGTLDFLSVSGKKFRFKHRRRHDFELGSIFIGGSFVLFAIRNEFKDIVKHSEEFVKALPYKDDAMRKSISPYIPNSYTYIDGLENQFILIKKPDDVFLLKDVLAYFNGAIPPKHVAWIISSLLNIECYLFWANITHQAWSIDNILVSPRRHSVMLLGWWYAQCVGTSLAGKLLPAQSVSLMGSAQLRTKIVQTTLDQDLIRAVSREILGDRTGARLSASKELPAEYLTWTKTPSIGNPIEDYTYWKNTVLPASFGAPKFHKLVITPEDIYNKE